MSSRNSYRWCVILLLVMSASGAPVARADSREVVAELAEFLSRLERLGFSGVVSVVDADGPQLARGYGLADREHGTPWTPATVSTVGSITKQFTGAAILALAEEGKVSIGDPMTRYFASVPEDKQGITLHHLLTHSSGIVDVDGIGDWDPVRREEFVRLAMAQELAFEPGQGYEYSNAGYSLLGAIIERVTGLSYETYVRRRLLLPAGMFETGYVLPDWGEGRLAQGYQGERAWGTVLGRPMAEDGPFWVLRGNGGIHTTTWDMVRWAQALLGGKILSPASMERYWTPHVDEGGGDSFYGYGWVVMDFAGTKVITHNGGNGIFFADMAIVPDAGLIVVLMTNVVTDFSMAGGLLETIGARLFVGEPLPIVPDVAAAEEGNLDHFAGSYELEGGGELQATAVAGLLEIEATDPRSFAALFSTRPHDFDRSARLTERIEEIAAAFFAGDHEPLSRAYGGQISAEALADRWEQGRAALEERYGQLRSYTVLGTALRDGRDVTLLRFDFADGESYRAYVWDPEEQESLQGVSRRGLDHVLRVHPLAAGGYASWDGRSATSLPVELVDLPEGGARLTIRSGSMVVAERGK